MSCSPFDLNDYFLKELPSPQRLQVEAHVRTCDACREDLDRLQITEAALFTFRDEEIPQRIAFVSDKIFEPSPLRRWFAGFWGSTARLGFASAAMLSCAIFYFAATRTAPAPNRPAVIEKVTVAAAPSPAQIQEQINQAVAVAVAEVEARQAEKTNKLVADLEHRSDEMRRSLQLVAGEYDLNRKRAQREVHSAMVRPAEIGDPK
uniref:Putative transmembrane anti-sigma factor n=1 Tax=Solibacter usitatus (strain Ellin6076) TaxID=234267 RepID=Q01NU6_SOLUE